MATIANHGAQAYASNGADDESRTAVPQSRAVNRGPNTRNGHKINGDVGDYDDIPENMYRLEKHELDPRWIHRDKLAKIESEELQAAGIHLANARSRSTSRIKSGRSVSSNDTDRRDEKRQRLQSPVQIDDEDDRASWDLRLPEEIEEEVSSQTSASQMYANPVLRKSGSKIPVLTSSPLPIPAERYERDTPVPRKRTASGSISIDGDNGFPKTKYMPTTRTTTDESDMASSVVGSSTTNSPQKHVRQRSKSINLATPPITVAKKIIPGKRNVSGPTGTPARPATRSGEQDREANRRSFHAAPEGDPPWLATMYKPDPMLPPDQQLIPTLAKKQMQAQWAAEGAMPKTYDPHFNPIDVQTQAEREKEFARQRAPSPQPTDMKQDPHTFDLKPLKRLSVHSTNGRPGTSGSITAGYSTMPQITSPAIRQQSPKIGGPETVPGRSTNLPAPTRMQETSLANEDEDAKKGCACCVVM